MLRSSLKGSMFAVEEVCTSEEALNLLHRKHFDLLMFDVEHLRGLAVIELSNDLQALAPQQ